MARYAVLGAGKQGAAVADDLARHGSPERLVVADQDTGASARVARGCAACEPVRLDATRPDEVVALFERVDVAVSCLPYWMHPGLVGPALATGTHLVDIGGDSEEALSTLARTAEAEAAGVAIATDAGLAPGLINAMALLGIARFDRARSARLYCGGLPAHPRPPLGYHEVFSLEGLVSEYRDPAFAARHGEVVRLEPMTGLEELQWEGLGPMEAFVTSGGSGTAPWSVAALVDEYEYKTLRFPGHCRAVLDLFASTPSDRWVAALSRELAGPPDTDQVLMRVVVEGDAQGRPSVWTAEMRELHDPVSGFTAMQRTTAYPASILAIAMAQGRVPPGCRSFENSLDGTHLVEELLERGIRIAIATEA